MVEGGVYREIGRLSLSRGGGGGKEGELGRTAEDATEATAPPMPLESAAVDAVESEPGACSSIALCAAARTTSSVGR